MSDKRKEFRRFSAVMFWSLSFLVVVICAVIALDEISSQVKVPNDQPFNYDSVALSVKQQIDSLTGAHDSLPAIEKKIFITGDEYLPKEIHDSLFSFEINYDSTKNRIGEWNKYVRSVVIYRLSDHKKIQAVYPPEKFSFESYHVPITVEDMNFDGYSDFRVLDFVMMYGQSSYHFWLYNPKKERFEPDTSLARTFCATFDQKNKMIYSRERLSGPFDEINQTFTWENNKLVLQEEEEFFTSLNDSTPYTITMKKRINGKLVERTADFSDPPITNVGSVIYDWDKLK
jgi:hypothetical protein